EQHEPLARRGLEPALGDLRAGTDRRHGRLPGRSSGGGPAPFRPARLTLRGPNTQEATMKRSRSPDRMLRAVAASAALALAVAGCGSSSGGGTGSGGGNKASAPGVTATTVTIGSHQPLTGPAAPGYSEIAPAAKAYFDYVNANGGINGRKIVYKYLDDGYNPT